MKYLLLFLALVPNIFFAQVVINEIDVDSPGTDDREFIELKSNVPFFALDGYVLVLYNGLPTASNANRSYFTLDLDGYLTDVNGIITLGGALVSPVPQVILSQNTMQNGEDAIALYQGNASDFPLGTLATTNQLVDAIVYGTSDPAALDLMALLNITTQYDENSNMQSATESIQRMGPGIYEIKTPTPGANNDGSGFVYNGLSIAVSESTLPEGQQMTIVISAQQPVVNPLSLTLSIANDTFNETDISGTLTVIIPSGNLSASTTITLVDDDLDEGDELMVIRFGEIPPSFNKLNDAIEVRIIDNDQTMATWGTPLQPTYGLVSSTAPANYYVSLEGLAGSSLKQALQAIIANPSVVREHTYGDAELILKQADQNPQNSNEVWLMYVEEGRPKYKFQNSSSSVGFWNREHIFPQSRGGFADATSAFADGIDLWDTTDADDIAAGHSDAHALRAEDGPENISRSNRDYGLDYNGPIGNLGSWKGDVARALFYMAVRYNALHLVNGNPPDTVVGEMGDLASLLAWHAADPPDDFEMNRNNIVALWQFNRNPFIDYPLLASYIFGEQLGQPWSFDLANTFPQLGTVQLIPNPATDELTVVGLQEPAQISLYNVAGTPVFSNNFQGASTLRLAVPPGFYMAYITTVSATVVRKLIVR